MGTVMKEKTIWQDEKYFIIRREPSLTNLLPTKLRRGGLHEKLRWMVQYIYGYHVYILAEKKSGEKETGAAEIGYCFAGDGASFRYTFARRGDVLIGPYFILPEKRGQGLAAMLVTVCLKAELSENGKAWEFIQHNNIASIRTAEKVGFEYYSECRYSRYLRILSSVNDAAGHEKLFCYGKEKADA